MNRRINQPNRPGIIGIEQKRPAKSTISTTAGKTYISRLVNSLYYLMECVFIIIGDEQCRLLAIHQGRVMADLYYPTLRGAKISFARVFRTNTWQKKMKPQWTQVFPPDDDWLEDKWKIVEQNSPQPDTPMDN
jgi:hypothetical protein